jgi:hypothetical protein
MEALYAMGAVCLVIGGLLWSALRASGRAAAAEAHEEDVKRRLDELKQSEIRKDETLARMAEADAASGSEPADRIRDRMRKRPTNTR